MTDAVTRFGHLPDAEPTLWQRIDFKWVLIGIPVLVAMWLALVPLFFLVWQSFLTPQTASVPARYTLENFITAYTSAETFRLFLNSVTFAAGASTFSLVLGTVLAWMNERTNTPFKKMFFALSIIPLVIPSILFTLSWMLLASPKIGIVNTILQGLFQTDAVFVNINTMAGMIWVDGLHYSPMAFLLMTAAFRSMDPSLEESAMMSGASVMQIAGRITLMLSWPAALGSLLILFIRSLESFEVPALLGLPVQINVYTSAIYQAIHQYPSQIGLAAAYAVTLLSITTIGIYMQSRLSSQGSKYSTVTGKGFRPRTIDLGKWRYVTVAFFFLYFVVIVLLPFLVLVWASLQRFYSAPSWDALKHVSLNAYRTILDYPAFWPTVWNSVTLSARTVVIVMLLASVISWVVVRTKIPGRWLLDNIASMPLVFPGLVLGLSIMICYLTIDQNFHTGIYGTIWIMLIAYVTRFMPYGMRYVSTSMLQIHKELEESAAMSGASWGMAFRRIVLPLLMPGLLAGSIYVLIVSIRELSSSILLYSPGTEVVSIMMWELWQNGQYVELSAFGVMLIITLFCLVMLAQFVAKRFGIKKLEANRKRSQRGRNVLSVKSLYTEYPGDRGTVVKAAQDVTFEVPEGKLFTLLGPSGCGKTTTLRSIAGLEKPTSGEIEVGGRVVYSSSKGIFIAPNKRNFGMVFQSYAIWPHMNVFQNVAFPLDVRKLDKKVIRDRVMRVLQAVALDHLEKREATKLSGGQQQRLALARALVMEPQLLLLDEPLSNLDAKLRDRMRTELKRLQRELNLTTIYVTHDQSEALALSHEIAVMNDGRVVQVGTPRQIYEQPRNQFVADFVGTTNFIGGTVTTVDAGSNRCVVSSAMGEIKAQSSEGVAKNGSVIVSIRPEDLELIETEPKCDDGDNVIKGIVHHKDFLGEHLDFEVKVGDVVLQARSHPSLRTPVGDAIYMRVKAEKCVAIPSDTSQKSAIGRSDAH